MARMKASPPSVGIFDLMALVAQHAKEEEHRRDAMCDEELMAWTETVCDKPRPLDALAKWIADETGIALDKVLECIHRARNGRHWGYWARIDGEWPDISPVAQAISGFYVQRGTKHLVDRLCIDYPDEAEEMGLVIGDQQKRGRRAKWLEVQQQLMRLATRDVKYTNSRRLAKQCRCSTSTVHKAFNPPRGSLSALSEAERKEAASRAVKLRGWLARHSKKGGSPNPVPLNDVHTDTTVQTREPEPTAAADSADADVEFDRLLKDVKPEEHKYLLTLDPKEREEMLRAYRETPEYKGRFS